MRRLIFISTLLAIVCAARGFSDVTVHIMTFNVRYGTADDGPNHWDKRKDVLVDTIRKSDPDIVGTQETLDFQADYVVAQLPQYRWFGVGREKDCSGEHMSVLYKKELLSPIDSGNFWLSETPDAPGSKSWDAACPRMVTWARFYHYPSKRYFYFFNTHFDHISENARQHAAQVLVERLSKVPNDAALIVTGDFNSAAGHSAAWTTLTQSGMIDSWLATEKHKGPTVTFGGFKAPPAEGDSRIDWVLIRGPIAVERCATNTFNADGRYPSDHYPVEALLRLTD